MTGSRPGATLGAATIAVVWALVCAGAGPAAAAVSGQAAGALLYETSDGTAPVGALPLQKTRVRARLIGVVARVEVQQTFNNPFTEPLEAIYVFPLPHDGAVSEMVIRSGDRTTRARIETRAVARERYARAKRRGSIAAMLEQERPNVFTQTVANIEPGKEVVVRLVYDVPLHYDAGVYEFAYPMVVGPRYVPGKAIGAPPKGAGTAHDTDQVPDASRVTPPVRKPGAHTGHDVTMVVTVNPGVPIQKIWSPTHGVNIHPAKKVSPTAMRVTLPPGERIPDKDFVVRYRLAQKGTVAAFMAQQSGGHGYFSLLVEPPAAPVKTAGKEIVFVVNTSAAMSGEPLALAKRAVRHALKQLAPQDTFRVIRFAGSAASLEAAPQTADARQLRRARTWINGLSAGGPAELIAGLREAFRAGGGARLRVVVLLTAGLVANEAAVLSAIDKGLDARTRLFAIGLGSSPNRYLLERAAAIGRGDALYVLDDESPGRAVARFYDRVRAPVLTDVSIDWNGLGVTDVVPARIPDLFAGQPVRVVGRTTGRARGTIIIRGQRGGEKVSQSVAVRLVPMSVGADSGGGENQTRAGVARGALGRLWARARIAELALAAARGHASGAVAEITRLGLAHGLVTPYTSLVADEERMVTDGGAHKRFVVPVEMPEGISYEAVFETELGTRKEEPARDGRGESGGDRGGEAQNGDGTGQIGQRHGNNGAVGGRNADSSGSTVPTDSVVNDDEDRALAAPEPMMENMAGSTTSETIMLRGLAPGRWSFGVGVGGGLATVSPDSSGGALGLELDAGYHLTPAFALGGELALDLPFADAGKSLYGGLLARASWAGLFHGRLQLSAGAGPGLAGTDPGLSYMGALDIRLPLAVRLAASLRLRAGGLTVLHAPDLHTYTVGVHLSF